MRTTLAIDDDVLAMAREMAASERKSVGEMISALARRAMRPAISCYAFRNGLPLLPVRSGTPKVTSEIVRQPGEQI